MTAPAPTRPLDDCFLTDRERMTHAEAVALLRQRVRPVVGAERVVLAEASGRILAEVIAAPRDVPLADNAAVDGYAFAHADQTATGGRFALSGRVAAGHAATEPLAPGTAVRIFTGAVMPEGADTVAMQEDCRLEEDGRVVLIPAGLRAGANRRRAGEDVKAGSPIAGPGTVLRPQEIAAIASLGRTDILVSRRVRVAVLSTGDELVAPGGDIAPGQVFDSNRTLLSVLAGTAGAAVVDLGIVRDEAGAVEEALRRAAGAADLILTTGGASRGEEDYVITTLSRIGRRHLWQLAVKPGRPMSFGQIGDCLFVGLPGNPVAAFVCFLLYVRPMLMALAGAPWPEPRRFAMPAAFSLRGKKAGRREFLRGILATDGEGRTVVRKFPRDGSGLITSLREADGLIEIGEDVTEIAEGDEVAFLPFTEFGLPPR